jgi:hypothetical protein
MAHYVSKRGVWEVSEDGSSLPSLSIENLAQGNIVKVTCQFFGQTMTDDLNDGFAYHIVEKSQVALIILTPNSGLVQGSDSWQLFSHVVLFEVPSALVGKKAEFSLEVSASEMNGKGSMMNYMLMAELID